MSWAHQTRDQQLQSSIIQYQSVQLKFIQTIPQTCIYFFIIIIIQFLIDSQSFGGSQSKTNVFDKLYQKALIKQRQMSQHNSQILNSQKVNKRAVSSHQISKVQGSSTMSQALGCRLYDEAIKKREDQRAHIQKIKQEQNEQIQKDLTFTPEINLISRYLAHSKSLHNGQMKIEDKLMEQQQIIQLKIEQKRNQKNQEEIQQLQEAPQINPISQYIMQEKSKQNPFQLTIHEDLFQDANRRQYEKNIDNHQNSKISHSNVTKILSPKQQEFQRRMQGSVEDWIERKGAQSREFKHDEIDYVMNQNQFTFQPQISTRSPKNRNLQNQSVHEYLHQQSAVLEKSRQQRSHMYDSHMKSMSIPQINQVSNKIVDENRLNRLHEIFQIFDHTGQGWFSCDSVKLEIIPEDILVIFAPLLNEMDDMKMQLNFEMFYDASCKLLETLNVDDKNKILKISKQVRNEINKQKFNELQAKYSFKPQINPISRQLASNSPKYESATIQKYMRNIKINQKNLNDHAQSYDSLQFHKTGPKISTRSKFQF